MKSLKRQRKYRGVRQAEIKGLRWVSLACHPSVITAPHVKHCEERETKGKRERKKEAKWKSKISKTLVEK